MRLTGAQGGHIRRIQAIGIILNGAEAGMTATRPQGGCRRSDGHLRQTGLRPRGGIPRRDGRRRRTGSDLVPGRFSISSTRCAAHRSRSEPAPTGAGSEAIKDRVDDVVANTDARSGHDRLTEPPTEKTLQRAPLRRLLIAGLVLRRLGVVDGRRVVGGL
jgi:hypothetical protein